MSKLRKIHIWIPELFSSKGGIQVFSDFFVRAVQSTYPQAEYSIFLKNDCSAQVPQELDYLPQTQIYGSGNWKESLRTLLFSLDLIAKAVWYRPSLIIVNHVNFSPIASFLKKLIGVRFVVNTYGIECWDIDKPIIKKALQSADRIFSISDYTRDRLFQEQGLDPSKVSLLPCTFDPNRFQISPRPIYLLEKYVLRSDQRIILTVTRLAEAEQYKGYDKIIEALPQIRQAIPNIHYIIIGKGSDRPRIEQLITKLNLQDCVTLAGFISDEQLCDYYNLCDVFAMPSKREGFGIVYLEALACGKPVLGGNQDGAVDALCQGKLGALVNPDCVDEIAEVLIKILQGIYPNPLMYQPEALRQKVIEEFGFEQFKQKLASYLEMFEAKDSNIG